jgi:hypothetical protein
LQDIMGFVILAHIPVDQTKKRVLIPSDQRFKSILITGKCLMNQYVV